MASSPNPNLWQEEWVGEIAAWTASPLILLVLRWSYGYKEGSASTFMGSLPPSPLMVL